MPVVRVVTLIRAPIERCFDLARSVDAHVASARRTSERAVAGVTQGLLEPDDEVEWEAVHFGIRQRLRVRITAMDRPRSFTDELVRGVFRRLRHIHEFDVVADGHTRMRDTFEYESPLGVLGRIADVVAVERHLRRFLESRNRELKALAESPVNAVLGAALADEAD
jgi:ligand-binding SRPBCC domain-containing protein